MDTVLNGIDFALAYIDDILFFSKDAQQHREPLHTVFTRIAEAGLTLRERKCRIGVPRVAYLGYVFSSKGMEVHFYWKQPENENEIRRFLGFTSYYRRFVPHFADIAKPLHVLLEKGTAFD